MVRSLLLMIVVCGVLATASPVVAAQHPQSTVRPFKAIANGHLVELMPGWRDVYAQEEYAIELRFYKNGKMVAEHAAEADDLFPGPIALATRIRGKMVDEPGGKSRLVSLVRMSDCCIVVPCRARGKRLVGWMDTMPRTAEKALAVADHFSIGGLDFYIYNPDADSFEVSIRCREEPGYRLEYTPGQPFPEMVSVPPGEYRDLAVLRARLYAPDLGFVPEDKPIWKLAPPGAPPPVLPTPPKQ